MKCIYVTGSGCGNPKIFGHALHASGWNPLSKFLNPPLHTAVILPEENSLLSHNTHYFTGGEGGGGAFITSFAVVIKGSSNHWYLGSSLDSQVNECVAKLSHSLWSSSLVSSPRAPPGKKQSGERSRIPWVYSPNQWKTNEIVRSLIIT